MENSTTKRPVSKKIIFPILLGLVLLGAIGFTIREYIYFQHHQDTDDAQIDGYISPIVSRVGGYITQIRFDDNQEVHQGDTLVVLDDKDYKIKLEQAEAALVAAKANVSVSQSNVVYVKSNISTAASNVEAAKIKLWKATQDFTRYQNLLNDHAITQSQFDGILAEKESAEAALSAAKSQLAAARKQAGSSEEQVSATTTDIAMKKADVDFAKLQLSYTVITAPISGIVSKRNIQPGQLIQAGQTLFAIVNDTSIYVTANFKETQMENLKPGQKANIIVDAYPNQPIQGTIDNFSGATGAEFSLLPPDNATGNFVKVVQRIPVKILLNVNRNMMKKLRPGMSVNVSVHIH
ncbi:MAG: HlyD family secretion protein [Chitinophagaceae bacterium]